MIISHKHKFIFIKTNKTAGTSIEIALSKFCGPDDVITPISSKDEETRKNLGYPGPQNYLSSDPLWKYSFKELRKKIKKGKIKRLYYNHISAKEIKKQIPKEQWNSYYKFCFERNPWDRVISLYYWKNKQESKVGISEFINSDHIAVLKERGSGLYTIDGKVVVDRVCKFENIAEELEFIREKVGIPEKLELPNAKSDTRKDKRSYRDILKDEDKAKVAELFSDEIKLLGYNW